MSEALLQAERVLVVDDHPASRYATVRVLRNAGFQIIEAETGAGALEQARNADIVVLDINLPDMDGFEVCRRLRASAATASMPVVHLSATFTGTGDARHGMQSGADSYLTHPAEPQVLVATVRALLFARHADAIRRQADTRFRTIFELTSGGIAILDAGLRLQDANAAFCQLVSMPREGLVGTPLSLLASAGFAPRLEEVNQELEAAGRWEGLVPLVRPDGSEVSSEWRIVVEADTGARVAMVTDVTERTRYERERERLLASERAARAEADRSNRLKDEFLAMLSHELRNPLAAILGWANLLRRTPDLPPMVRQGVEAIERNSRVQSQLTSDLLDFAGIQFGKMRLDLDVIDPMNAVDAAVEIIAPQAQVRQITLTLSSRADECSVVADETRLQQMIWNLLSNAVKFTPPGGRIDVAARVVDGWFEVDVTDTGKGISPEFLPRIFDRFSQQDSGTAKSFAGLGIGLTIVRHLASQHQATVEAFSPGEGQGSTFRLRLPLSDQPRRTQQEQAAVSLGGVHVLVVEDVDDARAVTVRLLMDAGARVSEAADGASALQRLRADKPDVLVSDIGMPRMDGYALIRAVRLEGYGPEQLPAIALTAFARVDERQAALEAGFQMHLGKPVNSQALIDAVARAHGGARDD